MSCRFLFCQLLVILLGTLASVAASAAEEQKTNFVSIEAPAGGDPMLVVRYPWTVHKNPSIEVRTYVEGEEESVRIRPLYFCHAFMKDQITIDVYEIQAAAAATRTTGEFVQGDIQFTAIGDRNLLGRAAVCVTCETAVLKPNKKAFPEKARWAIYPFAELWAADNKTLFLSPPEPLFAGPAKIRVFFMRDGNVVWSETKQWPGLKSAGEPQAQGAGENRSPAG
ncbi:MAG: hypothetical protein GXX96_11820 [Planctomycetaceae bacterium]|nr:hypothetical protein [Planctomycetaceae bacterium]